jgi:hypothetical protein
MVAMGYSDQKLLQTRDRTGIITDYLWQMRQNYIAARATWPPRRPGSGPPRASRTRPAT